MSYRTLTPILTVFLFIVLGFGIYSNTLESPFFFDDTTRIRDNHNIRMKELSFKGLARAAFGKDSTGKRPTGNISFALNYFFHEYELKGYHVVNIIIHILNGILLFIFFRITLKLDESNRVSFNREDRKIPDNVRRKTIKSPEVRNYQFKDHSYMPLFAALIWLVHPLHTQSVTYIVQRLNSMAALFFLISFLLYIKGRLSPGVTSGNRGMPLKNFIWFLMSALAWFLALGSKQIAAMLPFFIFLYEYYFFRNLDRKWLISNLRWVAGIVVLFFVIALIFLGTDPVEKLLSGRDFDNNEFTYSERILTQPRVVIYYLSLIIFPNPSRLRLDYDFDLSHSLLSPVTTILCLGLIAGLICLSIIRAREKRLLSFCILWFFGNLVIESSIIPIAIIYEHRTYLPSMFAILFFVIIIHEFKKPKWIGIALMTIVILVFSFWTYERNGVWKDEVSLWSDVAEKSPVNYSAHTNLGIALDRTGRTGDAIPHYLTAIKVKPDYAEAHNNLGVALEKIGRVDEAFKHYSEALKLDPRDENAQNNLGLFLVRQKQYIKATEYFYEALRLRPLFPEAHYNLGLALLNMKRPVEALFHFREAEKLIQNNPGVYYYLGVTLAMMEQYKEAADYFRRTLRIDPGNTEVQKSLKLALDMIK